MSERMEYLSDDELNQLIAEVEAGDSTEAPPELLESVLGRLDQELPGRKAEENNQDAVEYQPGLTRPPRKTNGQNRKKDFNMYCLRVFSAMAASLAILFLMPNHLPMLEKEPTVQEIPAKETLVTPVKPITKEEAINQTNSFTVTDNVTSFVESKIFTIIHRNGEE